MEPRMVRTGWRCLAIAVVALSLFSVAHRTAAGPPPLAACCACNCPGITACRQIEPDTSCSEVCDNLLNRTSCTFRSLTDGSCEDVPGCGLAPLPPAKAPTMGMDAMAVLAALLGATGVLRVRKGKKHKRP